MVGLKKVDTLSIVQAMVSCNCRNIPLGALSINLRVVAIQRGWALEKALSKACNDYYIEVIKDTCEPNIMKLYGPQSSTESHCDAVLTEY